MHDVHLAIVAVTRAFFFQAEDGIRASPVTGVQTCALPILQQVGLSDREHHFPHQLSGGESQRVAIARAVVGRPSILLADEPTGNLDNETGVQVANLLFDLVKTTGMTMLLVTHNKEMAKRCSRQMTLEFGTFQ